VGRPKKKQSHEAFSGTGPGTVHRSLGHPFVALLISTTTTTGNLTGLDSRLETRAAKGEPWVPLTESELTASDYTDSPSGGSAAYVSLGPTPADEFRVNVTNNTNGITIDAWILFTGYSGPGEKYSQ
jgi:hypothetical protein